MLKFGEFLDERYAQDIALVLYAADVDVDRFCEEVLELAKKGDLHEALVLHEGWGRNFLGGISNAATGAAALGGLGRFAGDMAGAGARAAGNYVQDDWQKTKDLWKNRFQAGKQMAGQAWDATGGAALRAGQAGVQAVGNAAQAGAQAVGNAASAVGDAAGRTMNTAGQYMNQSAQAEKLRQANNAVNALQKQLAGYGYQPQLLHQAFQPLLQALQADAANNKSLGYKLGSGTY